MEYFNTFGGNPVSATVGLAVLDVIEEEGLQDNAAKVGRYLLDGLRGLMADHDSIGDVRGRGLFLGIELVADRMTKAPAAKVTREIVNYAREHGVLLSIDGPHHNVIKIKPPMIFSEDDADQVVAVIDAALRTG
jgi:4-aminobutyrate aminotransferase-like enzyme